MMKLVRPRLHRLSLWEAQAGARYGHGLWAGYGVAATAAKALPICGTLSGGYLHTLNTDEAAAQGVLQLFDQDFRGSGVG